MALHIRATGKLFANKMDGFMTKDNNDLQSKPDIPDPFEAADSSEPVMLLVEDLEDVRTVFTKLLTSKGFAVSEMDNAECAMKFCKTQLPAVALIDADLGGSDGMKLGVFIRGLPGGDKVVLGTLTGNQSESCRIRAIQSGFDYHFLKPVKMKEVCQALKNRLAGGDDSPQCPWSLRNSQTD